MLTAKQPPVESAWQILETGVNQGNVEKRSDATQALGLVVHDRRARVLAEKALADDIAEVRASAATALGDMQSRASIPKLHAALSDKDPIVVLAAAHALLSLKDDRAYDVYYAVLTGQRKTGEGLLAYERKMRRFVDQAHEFARTEGDGGLMASPT